MNRLGKVCIFLALTCLFLSLGLRAALSGWMPFMDVGLGFTGIFLLVALMTNYALVKNWLVSDVFAFTLKSVGWSIIALVFLTSVNAIVAKRLWFFDLTRTGLNTLQPLTQSLLKALPEEAKFVLFHAGNAEARGLERQVRDEIQRYQQHSDKVVFESYSIFQRPDLAEEYRVGDETTALFIRFKGRIQRVPSLEERDLANTLLKVTRDQKKIYFIRSGEARRVADTSTFGLSFLVEQVQRLHYQVEEWDLTQPVPTDAVFVLWPGPKQEASEQALAHLESYLAQGGSAWLAWDPDGAPPPHTLFAHYGLSYDQTFLFDREPPSGQSPLLAMVHPGERAHEISRRLDPGANPFFFVASSLSLLEPQEGLQVTPLLEYLPTAQARKDIQLSAQVVKTGRLLASVISEQLKDTKLSRLLVTGDSDFLTNQFSQQPATYDFIIAALNYLSQDEDLLKLKPALPDSDQLLLTQTQINLYLLFFVLPLIGLCFLLAVFFKLRSYF